MIADPHGQNIATATTYGRCAAVGCAGHINWPHAVTEPAVVRCDSSSAHEFWLGVMPAVGDLAGAA